LLADGRLVIHSQTLNSAAVLAQLEEAHLVASGTGGLDTSTDPDGLSSAVGIDIDKALTLDARAILGAVHRLLAIKVLGVVNDGRGFGGSLSGASSSSLLGLLLLQSFLLELLERVLGEGLAVFAKKVD